MFYGHNPVISLVFLRAKPCSFVQKNTFIVTWVAYFQNSRKFENSHT